MLEQSHENYEFHQEQVKSCEEKIRKHLLKQVATIKDVDINGLEETKKNNGKHVS
jgi:hypothetical protein